MSRKFYLVLFLFGLAIALLVACLQTVPGYMDAEYYYAGGLRLAEGWGGNEPYLWNYLSDPQELPVPSFAYWMPFSSLVAAAGLTLARPLGFFGARLGFILMAALVSPLTALISYRLTEKPEYARLAGLLALFPGFYLAYMTTTDAFPVYMVLGGLFVLLAFERSGPFGVAWPEEAYLLVLGVLAGLMHMTRADGLLWLLGGVGVAAVRFWQHRTGGASPAMGARLAGMLAALLAGYALVTWPWYSRNLQTWGSLFPPGGSHTFWLTTYEETMIFPVGQLTFERWLSAGVWVHLQARLQALSTNLQTTLAIQGGVVLLPFILAALWKMRTCPTVWLGAGMWLVTMGLMTVVFPFAGINGGFFHSGAALQPFFWALAPLGIESLVRAYARRRRAAKPQRLVTFTSRLFLAVGVVLSGLLFYQRVVGSEGETWKWNASDRHYQEVEQVLVSLGATPCEKVLVNNPPGYWLASRRAAAVIPYGDEKMLMDVAEQFDIQYLVLGRNNPGQLAPLYHREITPVGLEYLTSVGDTQIYRIAGPE